MFRVVLSGALAALIAWPAFAEGETEEALQAAHERLEAAAREIAELTGQLGSGIVEAVREIALPGQRALLGIVIGEAEGDLRDKGVRVEGVSPGGPAEQAGLKAGDVVVAVDDERLADGDAGPQAALLGKMREVEPGASVSVEYLRGGRTARTQVDTERSEGYDIARIFAQPFGRELDILRSNRWRDLELVTLSPGLGAYFGTDRGLLVVRAPSDPELPLEDGDVILEIGGREPEGVGHAMRILHSYEPSETLTLEILRKRKRKTLALRPEGNTPNARPSSERKS